jgi:valyl-tRNA synthetase
MIDYIKIDKAMDIVRAVRKYKSQNKMAPNAPLETFIMDIPEGTLEEYKEALTLCRGDIYSATHVKEFKFVEEE